MSRAETTRGVEHSELSSCVFSHFWRVHVLELQSRKRLFILIVAYTLELKQSLVNNVCTSVCQFSCFLLHKNWHKTTSTAIFGMHMRTGK